MKITHLAVFKLVAFQQLLTSVDAACGRTISNDAHQNTILSCGPTSEPSWSTVIPTDIPSLYPTNIPTSMPSTAPTTSPTWEPTANPSYMPSVAPTPIPSLRPTVNPTSMPSYLPTLSPSMQPTGSPTLKPTGVPTASPSLRPTNIPTSIPSTSPTNTPSMQPSETPTNHPSLRPSYTPSLNPTSMPTINPSTSPTSSPTSEPTVTPSTAPSAAPTYLCNVDPITRRDLIYNIIAPDVTSPEELNDVGSSANLAFEWLVGDDTYYICPDDAKIIQRYVVAKMYFQQEGENWIECSHPDYSSSPDDPSCNPDESNGNVLGGTTWMDGTHECDWAFITCDSDLCITQIEVDENNVGGTLVSTSFCYNYGT